MKIHLNYISSNNFLNIFNGKLISLLLFFCAASIAKSAPNEGYQVTQFEAEPYTQLIQRTGKVDFSRVVNLSFKTAGFLTQLNVDEGDTFSHKQLLAALDTSELKADKNATYARLLQAKRNVSRIETLLKKNLSSQRDLDDALTAIETTRAAYRVAYYNLEKAQIFAPFDGVVVQRNTALGELQSPGVGALQVATMSNNLIVSAALTGEEISLVHLNQKVKVHLAYLGVVEGTISKVPAMADSQSHLFNIEVLLPETNFTRPFIVGQLAQVFIYAQRQDFVYRLPIEALNAVDKNGQALITIEQNNNPVQQAHAIYRIDNQYLYLQAAERSPSLAVITLGWNKLLLKLVE